MKIKRILRFYFSADTLNRAIDNVITATALKSADYGRDGDYYAERICALISAKNCLGKLWRHIDGVINALDARERNVLCFYAFMRTGIRALGEESRREIKRVTIKFTRRLRGIERFGEGIRYVNEYYCLMRAG